MCINKFNIFLENVYKLMWGLVGVNFFLVRAGTIIFSKFLRIGNDYLSIIFKRLNKKTHNNQTYQQWHATAKHQQWPTTAKLISNDMPLSNTSAMTCHCQTHQQWHATAKYISNDMPLPNDTSLPNSTAMTNHCQIHQQWCITAKHRSNGTPLPNVTAMVLLV